MIGVPLLTTRVSGSKSQLGSGVPAAALANRSLKVVENPRAMFLQKSGPMAALKVVGSHSSRATICAGTCGLGDLSWECSCAGALAAKNKSRQPASEAIGVGIFTVILLWVIKNLRSKQSCLG